MKESLELIIFVDTKKRPSKTSPLTWNKTSLRSLCFASDETLIGLTVESSRRALEMAKVKPKDVDLVLMCTSTPDDVFGGAPLVSII